MLKEFRTRLMFNGELRHKIYTLLAHQLGYNVAFEISLKLLKEQFQRQKKTLLVDLFDEALKADGEHFSFAIKNYVPHDELMLIQAGEKSGKAQETFLLAAEVIDAKRNIKSSVLSAIAYPAFLICLMVILLLVVSFMVIPNLSLISDPNVWTGSAYALYIVSNIINSVYGILLGISFLACVGVVIYSLQNLTGNIRVRLDKYPPYSIYRLTIGATWLFTLASLIQAGIQSEDILRMMLRADKNSPYLKERLNALIENAGKGGKKFGEAFLLTGMNFPDEDLVYEIKSFSELPDFSNVLYRIAKRWLQEGVKKIQEKAKIFNTICLCLVTFIIINIVLAFQNIQQLIIQGV